MLIAREAPVPSPLPITLFSVVCNGHLQFYQSQQLIHYSVPSNLPFTKVPPIEEATCDHGTEELVSGHDCLLAMGLPVVSSSRMT